MMLMATYGTLERIGEEKHRKFGQNNATTKTFQYPELVYNHFKYRHAVDDHNNRRQAPISIEKTWNTNWWPNRVFSFLISITEINTLLAWTNIYGNPDPGTLQFRKILARELIDNPYLEEEKAANWFRRQPGRRGSGHELAHLPANKKFRGALIVDSDSRYPQKRCISCKKKVRSYCLCTPGVIRCVDCFANHKADEEMKVGGEE